jgi:hypothetical protein
VNTRFKKPNQQGTFGLFTKSFAGSRKLNESSPNYSRLDLDYKKANTIYQDNQPILAHDLQVLMKDMDSENAYIKCSEKEIRNSLSTKGVTPAKSAHDAKL